VTHIEISAKNSISLCFRVALSRRCGLRFIAATSSATSLCSSLPFGHRFAPFRGLLLFPKSLTAFRKPLFQAASSPRGGAKRTADRRRGFSIPSCQTDAREGEPLPYGSRRLPQASLVQREVVREAYQKDCLHIHSRTFESATLQSASPPAPATTGNLRFPLFLCFPCRGGSCIRPVVVSARRHAVSSSSLHRQPILHSSVFSLQSSLAAIGGPCLAPLPRLRQFRGRGGLASCCPIFVPPPPSTPHS